MTPLPPSFSDPLAHQCTQVLYRCLEEVGSTKGALYLRVPKGQDQAGAFRLVADYGWPRGTHSPEWIQAQAPLLVLMQREKRVFPVNEPAEYPELKPFSEGSDSPRFLLAPIYLKGDWVGLLLQRDRIKGVDYDLDRDERPTVRICNDIVEVLAEMRLYREAPEATQKVRVSPKLALKAAQGGKSLKEIGATMPMPVSARPGGPAPAEGLIPELPQEAALDEIDGRGARDRYHSLPWDSETHPGPAPRPALITATSRAASVSQLAKRNGSALPEQRTFFWEGARLLARLMPLDAAALWMDEPDELRPILAFSDRPLSQELQQQVLAFAGLLLPEVPKDSFRILTRPEKREVTPIAGTFTTSFACPLEEGGGESSGKDLLLLFRLSGDPFTEAEESIIRTVARMLRLHLEEGRLHERYHRAFLSVSHRILKSGEGRAPKMREHSLTCAKLSRSVALKLELPSSDVEAISIAAILHDVGSLLLDPDLMKKPSLSGAELATVRTHPLLAETFLQGFRFPFDVLKIIRHHHERWDGRGYPDGLAGEAIPIGSRVIGLIEAYDAMTTGKDYKAPKAKAKAIEEMKAEAGFQFDPKAVDALLAVLSKGK